ncbi:hypothetical protein JRO89_XS02G0277600 [Xanthoceras sorbifolium]|uniref:Protein kinase domain-containing protein n=1 Tax=Xanthoceras sorbifolium TaxID=99658 RepID=A0ABQ8IHW2_9ROSI|nr:hypothetical protein JRO89_XS02G0277600 [Xanthoceras sorbifolium]
MHSKFILELGFNLFSGFIPSTIGNGLTSLQWLSLVGNNFTSTTTDLSFLTSLTNCKNLRRASFSGNPLNDFLPTSIGNLSNPLERIYFYSCNISGNIPREIGNLKKLMILSLGGNELTGSIPATLGKSKQLQGLFLQLKQFEGSIPNDLFHSDKLVELYLRNNKLSGAIPPCFGNMTSLRTLSLSSNGLSSVIAPSLWNLKDILHINLSSNSLIGTLPLAFGNLKVVIDVDLSRNHLTENIERGGAKNNDVDVSQRAIWRRISYQELVRATEGFSESNLLGRGGFGLVFKGKLLDGMEIAVKVFHVQMERALRSFDVECEVLSGICHRNLVKIINSCTNEDLKALVLEYMPNGSLSKCLYSNEFFMYILQRLNILINVASALEYLHFDYSIPIVHCDIKPSNVLLDQDMVRHLSDFGIAKLLGEEESMTQTQTQTLATFGYIAPEGRVSRKGDVHSYGIMLMETFIKKKPTNEIFTEEMSLRHWVVDSFNRSVMEVVDNDLLPMEDTHF